MESGEEKKGFTIRDRRASTQPAETDKEEPKKTESPSAGGASASVRLRAAPGLTRLDEERSRAYAQASDPQA